MVSTSGPGGSGGPRALPARRSAAGVWARPAGLLTAAGAAIWAAETLAGMVITRTPAGEAIAQEDIGISRWFAAERTPQLTAWTHLGSSLSDTLTAIAVTAAVVVVLAWRRRWRAAATVLVAILGELFVFVLVTATVRRARPPVPHLDPAPPTSSFPSGHTGAAVALYVGLAVLLWRSAVRRVLAVPLVVILCAVPLVVAVSRLYRGMHYLSDVVFGALGGGAWLLAAVLVVLLPAGRGAGRGSGRGSGKGAGARA